MRKPAFGSGLALGRRVSICAGSILVNQILLCPIAPTDTERCPLGLSDDPWRSS